MTLATLRKLDKPHRRAVLSAVASRLTPSPFEDEDQAIPPEERSLIGELGQRFGFSGLNIPDRLRPAVERMITTELRDSLVETGDISHVRERVGQKGLLRPDLYDIGFSPAFTGTSAKMGVSKDLAYRCVSSPTAVEHLAPDEWGLIGLEAQSVFSIPHPTVSGCTVLAITVRKNAAHTVDASWLAFHDVLGCNVDDRPTAVLKRFVDHYGDEITVGGMTSKFIILTSSQAVSNTAVLTRTTTDPADVRVTIWRSKMGIVYVGLAYAIKVLPYLADLAAHGIKCTRKPPTPEDGQTIYNLPA